MAEISLDEYRHSPRFSERERAAVLWAEHVARNTARYRDDVFDEVRRQFDDAELVELTGVCGLFAQSNRFQDSLLMPIEEQSEVNKIGLSIQVNTDRLKAYIESVIENWPGEFPVPESARPSRTQRAPQPPAWAAREEGPCRVVLPESESAQGVSAWFMQAAGRMLGGVPNAVRLWANIPHLGKLFLPLNVALFYEGAGSVLPTALKALVLVRTSHVNEAPYSLAHRTALACAAGVPPESIVLIASDECAASPCFSSRERTALAWAEHVARNTAKKRNDIYEAVRQDFTDAEIVELTGLCALANKLDRIENALRVPVEQQAAIEALYRSPRLDPARLKSYLAEVVANWPRDFPIPR